MDVAYHSTDIPERKHLATQLRNNIKPKKFRGTKRYVSVFL
jgi:hypothetical protein